MSIRNGEEVKCVFWFSIFVIIAIPTIVYFQMMIFKSSYERDHREDRMSIEPNETTCDDR